MDSPELQRTKVQSYNGDNTTQNPTLPAVEAGTAPDAVREEEKTLIF